ncbi:MAG: hypothetical protein QGF59_14980 [Pirellulaceae bacterium]|nr:hypothetical protein [Pirellulaceae bacterium]MDP6719962.1 hypothetical protein [Pirellulaceae bacterium]
MAAAKRNLKELIGLSESKAKIAAARERLKAAEAATGEASHDDDGMEA